MALFSLLEDKMIFISFGRWSSSHGRWFTRERIYWKGYRWTPFVRISWRYGGVAKAWDDLGFVQAAERNGWCGGHAFVDALEEIHIAWVGAGGPCLVIACIDVSDVHAFADPAPKPGALCNCGKTYYRKDGYAITISDAATWESLGRGITEHEPDQTYGACD